MEYAFTKSGNVIAKDSEISGAKFITNQGKSYIGHSTVIKGDRNNGKPIISWGQYVVLDDESKLIPAEKRDKFYPLVIGNHVYIGKSSIVESTSVGSHVLVGNNCTLGQFSVIKDCTVIPDNVHVPAHAVVGPHSEFLGGGKIRELPEATEEAIDEYCEMTLQGIKVSWPEF